MRMNPEVVLPLEKMTLEEKLEVLETVWADISARPEKYRSPDWHGEVLRERERGVANGTERILPLDEAEKLIADLTS